MNFITESVLKLIMGIFLLTLISACDNSDSESGSLSISITDAPVDTAENVFVQFNGVEIKPADGDTLTFDFKEKCDIDPTACQIDLLALTNGISASLLDDTSVPAGNYNYIRLLVNAEPSVRDSYIVVSGQEFELKIPSGSQTGLKLNKSFVVPASGNASFTIDFDLRKSVHNPVGKSNEYILRPTLRVVDNSKTGSLSGNIDPGYLSSGCSGAIYVFLEGTANAPDDEDGDAFDGPDPITSAFVDDSGNYKIGFLSEGDYLIALTCDASADDPEKDDDSTVVNFISQATVTITANNEKIYDFKP